MRADGGRPEETCPEETLMSGTCGGLRRGPPRVSRRSGQWPTFPTALRCAVEEQQVSHQLQQGVIVGQELQQEVQPGIEEVEVEEDEVDMLL